MQPTSSVKHVIYLMLENRSFDKVFGYRGLEDSQVDGVNLNRDWNEDINNKIIHTSAIKPFLGEDYGRNGLSPTLYALNTKRFNGTCNGGFVKANQIFPYTWFIRRPSPPVDVMGYYPRGSFPTLDYLADHYVLCDNYYCSAPTDTTPNRMFALSGTSRGQVVNPFQTFNITKYKLQCQPTIFDRLNDHNYSWKVYSDTYLPFSLLLLHQWKPRNLWRYSRLNKLYRDIDNNTLPTFSFIEPNYSKISMFGKTGNVSYLENLVSNIYTKLKSNNEIWNSTLLIINFDEGGGFYDHVFPPKTIPPDNHIKDYTFTQYGVRVPCLIISPLVNNTCDHTTYDHTSILATIERLWKLPPLTKRDQEANDMIHLIKN